MFAAPTAVEVADAPDSVAAEIAAIRPGADTVAALTMLDAGSLSDAGRIDLLVACERHIAMLQAAQQKVLAALDGRALDWSGQQCVDYTREQVGAALRLSPGTAQRRLSVARALVDRLPATLALLRAGRITYLHAMKLAEAVSPFDDKATATIEDRVRRRAAEGPGGEALTHPPHPLRAVVWHLPARLGPPAGARAVLAQFRQAG